MSDESKGVTDVWSIRGGWKWRAMRACGAKAQGTSSNQETATANATEALRLLDALEVHARWVYFTLRDLRLMAKRRGLEVSG